MNASKTLQTKCDEKKITPNHIPAKGWKGGFIEKHPELQYKDGVADLTSLPLTDNLDNVEKIKRQQRVLWPEFTWLTKHGEPDSRCFQMFAPDVSRAGYDNTGQNWAVICPQQGTYIPGFGTINVEVTVAQQRGWVNESDKTLAIDMIIKPKIWFSRDANQSALGKIIWGAFELANIFHHLPVSKDQAIKLDTSSTIKMPGVDNPEVIFVRDKLYTPNGLDNLPAFTLHNNVAWNYANVEVVIGEVVKTGDDFVDEFNQLVMNLFNLGSGNLLEVDSTLAWNVWVDAPTKVNQTEWRNHADYWRRSIDVNHCSPDGNGSPVRYANGTEFSVEKELIDDALQAIWDFIKSHI
ncbi:MAG: hypothetical protein AB8B65_19750 [Kordia sp.]|uniref:hypothetical protein n=1 Tax=Kordia sp. TaxID=1965332 RepID=UPI00385FF06A